MPLTSTLNNSLNNLLNKNIIFKSTPAVAASVNNISNNQQPPSKSENGKIYGSSLLCYQNVPPPSPTSSVAARAGANGVSAANENANETEKNPTTKKSIVNLQVFSGLTIGDTATLPVAVKKRSKLRHRFSDVGSWGRKKKERTARYRSMNVESLEVLGDPVIEDEFFVSFRFNSIE